MKLDKNKLDELLKQNDDALWAALVSLAASKGFKLPSQTPPPSEMAKLRSLLEHPEKISMTQAIRLLNHYKQKG
ncbi:MAG: hypothetical protein J6V82_02360 [Clostridia bacterium]|nr:hypothetical protein [Clostridia bacterium]MBO7150572.1 hypothetical protein [Clostridia bacterium]